MSELGQCECEQYADICNDCFEKYIQQVKEECAKENRILIYWLANLERKIRKNDEFKGLRGYPITHFIEKYKPKK